MHPTHEWIRNKEPNEHVNIIADEIIDNIKNDYRILFLSHFDRLLYEKINKLIGRRALILDPKEDLNINVKNPDQALIQEKINDHTTDKLLKKHGVTTNDCHI